MKTCLRNKFSILQSDTKVLALLKLIMYFAQLRFWKTGRHLSWANRWNAISNYSLSIEYHFSIEYSSPVSLTVIGKTCVECKMIPLTLMKWKCVWENWKFSSMTKYRGKLWWGSNEKIYTYTYTSCCICRKFPHSRLKY